MNSENTRAAALETKEPKRTKESYEKADLSLIEKIEILKSGERLYLSANSSAWICENDMNSWSIGSLDSKEFYRRIEAPIEWWEDAAEFINQTDDDNCSSIMEGKCTLMPP